MEKGWLLYTGIGDQKILMHRIGAEKCYNIGDIYYFLVKCEYFSVYRRKCFVYQDMAKWKVAEKSTAYRIPVLECKTKHEAIKLARKCIYRYGKDKFYEAINSCPKLPRILGEI